MPSKKTGAKRERGDEINHVDGIAQPKIISESGELFEMRETG